MRARPTSLVLLIAACLLGAAVPAAAEPARLTVMTFNTWGLGQLAGQPLEKVAEAIRAAKADIVGIQETRLESVPEGQESDPAPEFGYGESRAAELAKLLGWSFVDQVPQAKTFKAAGLWANAVISRYPIAGVTPHQLGVLIDVDGRKVGVFNVHLNDAPYQPYQLTGIAYGDYPFLKTEAEAVAAARQARGEAVQLLLAEIAATPGLDAAFVTGDFNEPSWRDWSEAAVAAGRQPLPVRFPSVLALEEAGFLDALRTAYPDVAAKPAFTWTPTSDPASKEDHHDRIDMLLARATGLKVLGAAVVGEKAPEADIVVAPWPSDHRAVVATFEF